MSSSLDIFVAYWAPILEVDKKERFFSRIVDTVYFCIRQTGDSAVKHKFCRSTGSARNLFATPDGENVKPYTHNVTNKGL